MCILVSENLFSHWLSLTMCLKSQNLFLLRYWHKHYCPGVNTLTIFYIFKLDEHVWIFFLPGFCVLILFGAKMNGLLCVFAISLFLVTTNGKVYFYVYLIQTLWQHLPGVLNDAYILIFSSLESLGWRTCMHTAFFFVLRRTSYILHCPQIIKHFQLVLLFKNNRASY